MRHDALITDGQIIHGFALYERAWVGKQPGKAFGRNIIPTQAGTQWIGVLGCAFFANAVNAAFVLGTRDAGKRALVDVPGAGVDHEQAAIGRLKDVSGMEVRIGRVEKLAVQSDKGRAAALQHMPLDALRIEMRAKQVAAILWAERLTSVAH